MRSKVFFVIAFLLGLLMAHQPAMLFALDNTAVNANAISLPNGDFEAGTLGSWSQCGGARVVTKPLGGPPSFASGNTKALLLPSRLASPQCRYYFVDGAKVWQKIDIPSDATALVVSFWHYNQQVQAVADLAAPNLVISLLPEPDAINSILLGALSANAAPGWNLATFQLNPAAMNDVRGKQFYLQFKVGISLIDTPPDYYIDAIQAHSAVPQFTVPQNTLPSDLQIDRSKPILGIQYTNDSRNVVRLNPDGTGLQSIFSTVNYSLSGATWTSWSPNGQRIAVGENAFQEDPTEWLSDRARITLMHVIEPDGTARRELFRTQGQAISPGDPRGCTYPRTDCRRQEINGLDVLVNTFEWSPDSQQMLTQRCVNQRWSFGYTDDATCTRVLRNATTGAEVSELGQANILGNWGANNRLLFTAWYGSLRHGIYEQNMATPHISPTLVFSHYDIVLNSDIGVLWMPNDRYFLTFRRLNSFWYDGAVLGGWRYGVMLFDVEDIQSPTQLIFPDHIKTMHAMDVSPDGKYVIYAATDFEGRTDLWWLRLVDGETGRITTGANISTVSWRRTTGPTEPTPTATRTPTPTYGPTSAQVYLPLLTR
jgi:hypothetical protein